MDVEMSLGWLMMVGVVAGLLYLLFRAFLKQPAETLSEFRRRPFVSLCALLGAIGIMVFFVSILSLGVLMFDVPTPWGKIKSQWAGGLLALVCLPGAFSGIRGKR